MTEGPACGPRLRPGELLLVQRLVQQLTGAAVGDGDGERFAAQLEPLAQRLRCGNFNELYFRLRHGGEPAVVQAAVDAITVPDTGWFRDGAPFASLQHALLPAVLAARDRLGQSRTLRIWSAACSTGQEPYAIAMVAHEVLRDEDNFDVHVLATDISRSAITVAQRGVYPESELLAAARPDLVRKYCERTAGGLRVSPAVRDVVEFRQRDLMSPLLDLGPFDVIFLRNVLPSLATTARRDIAARVADRLLPHGFLVVGDR